MHKFILLVLTLVLMSACASKPTAPTAVAATHAPSAIQRSSATAPKQPMLATGFDRYFNTQTENWDFPADSDRASQ